MSKIRSNVLRLVRDAGGTGPVRSDVVSIACEDCVAGPEKCPDCVVSIVVQCEAVTECDDGDPTFPEGGMSSGYAAVPEQPAGRGRERSRTVLGPSSGETNGVSEPGPYGGGPGAGTTAESETADDVGDSAFEPDHTVEGRALRLLAEAGLSPEVVDRVPVHALVDDRRTA